VNQHSVPVSPELLGRRRNNFSAASTSACKTAISYRMCKQLVVRGEAKRVNYKAEGHKIFLSNKGHIGLGPGLCYEAGVST